jgi:hypothetical protein
MAGQGPKLKRPHRLLRALLTGWLLSWGLLIILFIVAQLDAQPLFPWSVALVWLGVMGGGWLIVLFLLRRLLKMPPE